MSSGDYAAISTLTEFFDELVLRVNNESRIESGKAVSLHGDGAGRALHGGYHILHCHVTKITLDCLALAAFHI